MQSLTLTALQLLVFSSLFYLYHPTQAQELVARYRNCDYANNYTSGSVYEKNLNLALSSLASNASLTGFYTTSVGQNFTTVYGLIQCRGDISKEECQICANTAYKEITQLCAKKTEAFIAYDYCLLRYSDQRFFSTVSLNPIIMASNIYEILEPALFTQQLGNLIATLSSSAASRPSKFAAGIVNYTNSVDIYAMVQCTRDLAENSCSTCLQYITGTITKCCNGKQGGQVVSMTCNLRFEIYSFFQQSPPPPETLPPPSPTKLLEPNSTNPEGDIWCFTMDYSLFQSNSCCTLYPIKSTFKNQDFTNIKDSLSLFMQGRRALQEPFLSRSYL